MQIATNNSTVQTNSTSIESHSFSIGDVSTIIDILRNRLYSNPIQTLTQEYLSNARDSHRESKQARPITVTLPTKLDSVLKIRDYGVGLDKQRVRDVFVNYGISTKRSDNSQTGGFGLGAKSAWAYTDSFTVVSFYEGRRHTYIAHTGKNKNGTFELIDECDTNEPNGVEVQIPVKEMDIYKFVNAVYRTTLFWENKPELKGITKMEIPDEYTANFQFKKNGTTLVPETQFMRNVFNIGYSTHKIFALIDGIPYDLAKVCPSISSARQISTTVRNTHITFISVNNGDISVAASREEISSDQANMSAIDKFCTSSVKDIVDIVVENFDNSFNSLKNYVDVYEAMSEIVCYNHLTLNEEQKVKVFRHVQNGIVFTFDLANNYTCDKFEKIMVHSMKKKRVKSYLESDTRSHVEIGNNKVIVLVDEELSDAAKKRKIRSLLVQSNVKIYEITCKTGYLQDVKDVCGARLISELKAETRSYNPRTGRIKEDDEVQIRTLEASCYSDAVQSNGIETKKISEIEESDDEYVLVPFSRESEFDKENRSFIKMVDFLCRNNKVVIRCGKKDYDRLVELDNVEEYKDIVDNFVEHYPLSEEKIRKMVFSGVDRNLFGLRKHSAKINCPMFQKLFEMYPERLENTDINMDEALLVKHYPAYNKAVNEFKLVQKLEEGIKATYSLLGCCFNTNYTQEFIHYINGKAQATIKA
jgi:hypothetical protein